MEGKAGGNGKTVKKEGCRKRQQGGTQKKNSKKNAKKKTKTQGGALSKGVEGRYDGRTGTGFLLREPAYTRNRGDAD